MPHHCRKCHMGVVCPKDVRKMAEGCACAPRSPSQRIEHGNIAIALDGAQLGGMCVIDPASFCKKC